MIGYPGTCDIKVEHINKDRIADITQLITSVMWDGDIQLAYRSLEVTLSNTENGRDRRLDIRVGDKLKFYNNGVELFRGRIFAQDITISGLETLRCYDNNIYLAKNATTQKFTNVKASDVIAKLCNDFGIPKSQIDDTGYVIPKMFPREKTLFEIMTMALTETRNKTGRKYLITNKNGNLCLLERKKQVSKWMLENGVNILDASYSISIEDLRNRVKIIGGDTKKGEFVSEVSDAVSSGKYGLMQHIEVAQGDKTKSQVVQMAKAKLKELNTANDEALVTALGIDDVIAGKAVYLNENMTNLFGGYYVQSDSHTFENGIHTMNLVISATDELPKLEIELPDEPEAKKKKKEAAK